MPFTSNKFLQYYLLNNSVYSIYVKEGGEYVLKTDLSDTNTDNNTTTFKPRRAFLDDIFGNSSTIDVDKFRPVYIGNNIMGIDMDFYNIDKVTPYSADYQVFCGYDKRYLLCFKYSPSVLRLRKVLKGLGFGLMVKDGSRLSVAPLLAFYKAYYDRFGLVRTLPFETTACFKMIKAIEDYTFDFSANLVIQGSESSFKLFTDFLNELSNCWFTDSNSYLAAQRDSLVNGVPLRSLNSLPEQNGMYTPQAVPDISTIDFHKSTVPSLYSYKGSDPYITQLSLDVLKRLTTFVNKDSAIGKRMSDWVRAHYGADVSNSLFEESSRINEWHTNIDIDDVFSTSDTADIGTKNKGEYLGSYAGKGSGFSQNGFSFKAPVHGFVFVMSCIVPLTNTFQGNDPTLFGIDLDTIPQPEFDALGFEATRRSVFVDDNDVVDSKETDQFTSESFGFVPRYTGFKVKKNIVNGDMSKGYYQTDLLPYFNDRILYNVGYRITPVSGKDDTYKLGELTTKQVPNASTEFQKVCQYGFIGNYNRLFYQDSDSSVQSDIILNTSIPSDNFIVQTVFDMRVSNWMKPVQNSYDTVDEDVDNNTTSVSTI
nr:MAG: major capsid protein [Microviridae sp.]